MQDQLQKAITLAKKTGDRLIVFDPTNTELTYVVMTIDDYERMVDKKSEVKGLTEDELLDKINRDIANWKSEQDYNENINTGLIKETIKESLINREKIGNLDNFSQGGYISGAANLVEKPPVLVKEDKIAEEAKNKWSIPSTRKRNAEEIIDEDTQYLEEITF